MHAPLGRPLRLLLPLLAGALLAGCPDPSATVLPPAGHGSAPPEAGGQAPAGGVAGVIQLGSWDDVEGDTVTLSGTASYEGSQTGPIRIDFLGAGNLGGLQHTTQLDAPGPWSVEAPAKLGSVYVVAFVDIAKDGPSSTDPAGRTAEPVAIGKDDVSGIDLVLVDEPDLGELTPGGPPPGTQAPPPPGTEGGAAEGGAAPEGGPPAEGGAAPEGGPPAEGGAAPEGGPPAEAGAPTGE